MAETAAGGWVRSAVRSAVSTRPCAWVSGTLSGARGRASLSTRACASATESSAATDLFLCFVVAGLAAALFHQMDVLDAHAALDRLDHVVDGEAGDRGRHQGLHLDAGLAGDLHGRAH